LAGRVVETLPALVNKTKENFTGGVDLAASGMRDDGHDAAA